MQQVHIIKLLYLKIIRIKYKWKKSILGLFSGFKNKEHFLILPKMFRLVELAKIKIKTFNNKPLYCTWSKPMIFVYYYL